MNVMRFPSKNSLWLQYGLIIAWTLAMIAVPIIKWTFSDESIPGAITFALLIQFFAVVISLNTVWNTGRTFQVFVTVAVLAWTVEFIGSKTGYPFGRYSYTEVLQPQLGDVPLLIPFAWFMMLPCAWAVAQQIGGKQSALRYIGISAVAMTAWDLFLDPQMVMWGFWIWDKPGGYFGIPWVNYLGWLLTAAVITAVVRPYCFDLPTLPLLVIYGVVWFLQSIGLAVFWGQPGPALVGSVTMGALVYLAVRKTLGEHTQ